MPDTRTIAINLLGEEDLSHTPQGRIVKWALTYGRYIMIGTEIVVLLAFISRFSLDRKLTDLKEDISQKQAILEANLGFERDITHIQEELTVIRGITLDQQKPLDIIKLIQSIVPQNVSLESLKITSDKVSADATAGTSGSFSQFMANLQAAKGIGRVEIGDINKSASSGIVFKFTASLNNPKSQLKK